MRNFRRNTTPRTVVCIFLAFLLLGCSDSDSPELSSAVPDEVVESQAAPKIFDGTPEEHNALTRACLEDHGVRTMDDPMGDDQGFVFDMSETNSTEIQEIFDVCEREVGVPKLADLSQNELRERYDARVEQHTCLVDEGYVVDAIPSFETFVDDYQRSGEETLWEPAALPDPQPGDNPATDCPRIGHW